MLYYRLASTMDSCLGDCLEDQDMVKLDTLWKDSRNLWFAVLKVCGQEEELWTRLGRAAAHMRRDLKRDFLEFAVYLSEEAVITETYEQTTRIRQIMFNNIAYGNGVFFVCDFTPEPEEGIRLDTEQVEEWLLQADEEALYAYIEQWTIRAGEKKNLSAAEIQRLILDWMQAVFFYLRQNQIEADRLFATEEYKLLYEKAGESLRDCREYLRYLVDKSLDYGKYAKESEDIVNRLERYIEDHLSESLTRADLAEVVYLNSDYLAQMFKKAKGVSLLKYINSRRLERAKELLLTTGDPVYAVAQQAGYPTSSYFSRQFREHFGFGPNEFRKQPNGFRKQKEEKQ